MQYSIEQQDVLSSLQSFKDLYPQSRFLFACHSCFNLKPPVVVEFDERDECMWCCGNKKVLLCETQSQKSDKLVEYDSIRERLSHSAYNNALCEYNLGLRWKPCTYGDKCNFAHSKIELKLWNLQSKLNIQQQEVVGFFKNIRHAGSDTLKGVFHCFICSMNLPSGKDFSAHCDLPTHKNLMLTSEGSQWKYRQLPDSSSTNFVLCPNYQRSRGCRNGDGCEKAHGEKELEEWKKRLAWQKERLKAASDSGLVSFADKISQEYEATSSPATVLHRKIPGIKMKSNYKPKQRIKLKDTFKWKIKLHCTDTTKKLNHAAFIMRQPGKMFQICRWRGKSHSSYTEHLDFTVLGSGNDSLNLQEGRGTFEVKFKPISYGRHCGRLVFEFRESRRPAFLLEFLVDVFTNDEEMLQTPNPVTAPQKISWQRDREIIRWDPIFQTDFDEVLQDLSKKYKPPDAALDFSAGRDRNETDFYPDNLNSANYVAEMHNFLYREENARNQKLAGARQFTIAFTENYMSSREGLCFNRPGQLFAITEVPSCLNRDTDEGLLILENCSKVLVARQQFPDSPVYEVLIEEKFVDHIVLLFSESCVKDWRLATGDVLETEILFLLDRDRFCRCHCALDQLNSQDQLPLLCPDLQSRNLENFRSLRRRKTTIRREIRELDDSQKSVLEFMDQSTLSMDDGILPLFVVQGSFGTGKTYTISKCIMRLLESQEKVKILVCTHSNSAADLYIENNFKDVNKWKDKVVRVYYHGRRPNTVKELVRNYCLWREDRRGLRYPLAEDVASHSVFVTTFETALALGIKGTGLIGAFTHIFIDEAAQAMETATIIPLTLANSRRTKVVVAGDHKQMTEKIYSRGKMSDLKDSNFTLLERMFTLYCENKFSNLVVLRNNYRCVPPVLALIESLFYKSGLLIPCTKTETLLPAGLLPIQFYNVEGICEQDPFTSGYTNEFEVFAIKDILHGLLNFLPRGVLEPEDIAVVSSYTEQVNKLRRYLRQHKLGGVQVDRVRNMQGLECKVVILSCVHRRQSKADTDGENFGILSDANLLNTAFTRTKLAIIAVGHAVTICSLGACSAMWKKYIQVCARNNSLFPESTTFQQIREQIVSLSSLNPTAAMFFPTAKQTSGRTKYQSNKNQASYSAAVKEEIPKPDASFDDDDESDSEDNLPLKDEILDRIISTEMGINPSKAVIRMDLSGREFAAEQDDRDVQGRKIYFRNDFSFNQLIDLLDNEPDEYRRCRIHMITSYSAEAVVLNEQSDLKSILINTKVGLGQSFDQDEVAVRITKTIEPIEGEADQTPRVYGKVIGILSRYKDPRDIKFVCVPDKTSPGLMCPVNRRCTKFAMIRSKGLKEPGAKIPVCKLSNDGDVTVVDFVNCDVHSVSMKGTTHFVVRFLKWLPHCIYPIGYVSEVIKPHEFEKYYAVVHDLPPKHKSLEKAAEKLPEVDNADGSRKDLTDLFVFTIDPKGSTDLDDALSLEKCETHDDCWKVGIHIADVASVVPAGSDIDVEAKRRAVTFYSGTIKQPKNTPMLPQALAGDKCSLLANKTRPAISTFIHSSRLPVICSTNNRSNSESNIPAPVLSLIRSRRQMTYGEAEKYLRKVRANGGPSQISSASEENIADQLYIMWGIMLKLRVTRLQLETFFARPDFNKFSEFCGEVTAHMLIEEAMITLNACTSIFLDMKGCEFLQRIQDPPHPNDWQGWADYNRNCLSLSLYQQSCLQNLRKYHENLANEGANEIQNAGSTAVERTAMATIPIYPNVWSKIEQALRRGDVDTALVLFCSDTLQPGVGPGYSKYIKIQNKAELQVNTVVKERRRSGTVTHFSLRLPVYSWCSSPIRRYTDILAQRCIVEKCATATRQSSNPDVIVLGSRQSNGLSEVCKSLTQRMSDAKNFENDTRRFSFAQNLSKEQHYELAYVTEIDDSEIVLDFADLKGMPRSTYRLKFSELNLHKQDKSNLMWKIRYYDICEQQPSEISKVLKSCFTTYMRMVSTTVDAGPWLNLLAGVKMVLSEANSFADHSHVKSLLEPKFGRVLRSQKSSGTCSRKPDTEFGPCNNDKCRKSQPKATNSPPCPDVLVHPSKLGINHYRRLLKSVYVGMPVCVQLYCNVRRGTCEPALQLVTVGPDLDICLSHVRSPIEIFAADVRPKKRRDFATLEAYNAFWMPLLRMDGVYNAVKDSSNAITLQNVWMEFSESDQNKLGGVFAVSQNYCAKRLVEIRPYDFLCIRMKSVKSRNSKDVVEYEDCYTWVAHADIVPTPPEKSPMCPDGILPISFTICTPQVSAPTLPDGVREGKLRATVEVIQLGVTHRTIANALHKVTKTGANDEILSSLCLEKHFPEREECDAVKRICSMVGAEIVPGMKYRLNNGQIEQIQLALGRKLSMIQGPPGTGKSFVGAHLAYYFVQLNTRKLEGQPGKILYCGPSNKSVDVVAEYLLQSRMKVLRVYGKTFEEQDYPNPLKPDVPLRETEKRPDPKIQNISLHHKIRRENKRKNEIIALDKKFRRESGTALFEDYKQYKRLVNEAKLEELNKHDVIICTCATASILQKLLEMKVKIRGKKRTVHFTQCIIDECGMCSEPETLAPIVTSQASQVVLIGDHKQLQPIIMCGRAKDFGLGVSMFERLHERAGMLTTQYRMHKEICDFPSKQFYDDRLETDDSVFRREHELRFRFSYPANSNNTAVFCHVIGREEINYSLERGGEKSLYNETEARVVIKILVYLHMTKGIPLSSITVLSPYTAQVSTITSLIKKERSRLSDVHVGTVVTSQGSESDYVILSTVRSQPEAAIEEDANLHWRRKFIGFVTDPHQINVAITRAKSGLCIVGNKKLLEKDTETWKDLLDHYERKRSVVNFADANAPWNRI